MVKLKLSVSRCISVVLLFSLLSGPLYARISRVLISKTEPYMDGRTFGRAGSFVRITGQVYGEVDPGSAFNNIIQDISLAPVNEKGFVEYVSDFIIVRPVDMTKSNGLLFLSLPNRGNAFPADTVLLSRGYTYLWCAWQGDVVPGNNRLTMRVPYAGDNGKSVTGIVRAEYQVNAPASTLVLSSGPFTGQTHHTYPAVDPDDNKYTLTQRVHESDERVIVPDSLWRFSDSNGRRYPGVKSNTRISLKDGFQPGYIYELIYTAKDPLVLGLGFAAVRDYTSFLRFNISDDFGQVNPLVAEQIQRPAVRAAIMQGVSQCSNFARSFLQLGFNSDEEGRQVFEGVNAHIGTRKIALNIRFGRPGGVAMQHEDHLFPGAEPPYSWDKQYDPISGITGGILEKCIEQGTVPKIMQTLSSTEYWQSRASLTTTDSYGSRDLVIPGNVRIYLFASTQHTPSAVADPMTSFQSNSNNYFPYLRALLVALEKWVLEGKEPPVSCYPTIAAGTLVSPEKTSVGWPGIPGVTYEGRPNELPLLNYGNMYDFKTTSGIITTEPPVAGSEKNYRTLVPKTDKDGNEIGGIRSLEVRVPLGTSTGWALRKEGYGRGDQASLTGMYLPFRKTREERLAAKDPRLSVAERYKSNEKYMELVRNAAAELVRDGYLLPDDAVSEIEKAEQRSVLR